MNTQLMTLVISVGALVLGGIIGLAFGAVQNAAFQRHKKLEGGGNFRSGWSVMPGSMKRVAFLLIALTVVQLACPVFFESGPMQWILSAGVVIGYGWTLLKNVRQRMMSGI